VLGDGLAVGDFNGDGAANVAASNSSGSATVLGNAATDAALLGGAVGLNVSVPATATAGAPFAVTVSAVDAGGNVVPGFLGTVGLNSVNPAWAAQAISYTFTAADTGVHTFTGTLRTAGTQSITVKDAASAAFTATQAGISVTPSAAAGSFIVASLPATTAGVAQSFTVTVKDPFGNFTTASTGTVTFSSSDVQAGLPASYAFTAADAGVHTLSATLKTAGPQSITVKDAADATILGSQTGIAVTAAAAVRFSISAPGSVTQGAGFKFTVTVLDAYGNVATGYRGKVHLSSTDPRQGTQDYTFSSSDNGVHVFSFTFSTLGSQTLTLVDTTNGSLVGNVAVNVLPR
jgi:hypothetical protein